MCNSLRKVEVGCRVARMHHFQRVPSVVRFPFVLPALTESVPRVYRQMLRSFNLQACGFSTFGFAAAVLPLVPAGFGFS
jgi:hypothetical protein